MSSAKSPYSDEEKQLISVEKELSHVNKEIKRLTERRNWLIKLKDKLQDEILLKKSNTHCTDDWNKDDFAWSSKVYTVLKNKFKLAEFRTNQLAAINVTLLKKDAIVIMPTGSGKSLCYQLPALLDQGITVVISPMISLMEDQIGQLRRLNISAEMLQASNTREENGRVMKLMADKSSLKLLYVSPEKLAKSKTFMTKLQKMYKAGAVARFAIDEVHCCSTWGHDFRPDYQYLSILKTMFPEIPILGLTATATTKVMLDVQKMLQIEGCVVLKAPFNRPNLFYEVRVKPAAQKDCMDELEGLMKNRFRNESGIIYTTSIKECEELRDALRARGLRVSAYHARLESDMRSKVHTKWLSGEYQAVVATIAFGLGIDKPNVRFVIHHCLSKSMENFYQESGRAGRDGKTAYCILYYRLSDVLKLSPMVFDQQTGLPNLYNIVSYCLEPSKCRRSIIASYFDEPWSDVDCNSMCDHCSQPAEAKEVDITKHARTLCTILEHVADKDVSVTAAMLLDLWYRQKVAKVKDVPGIPSLGPPSFPRITGENIIAHLLIKLYLKQDFHFTPYSTISYLKVGPKGSSLLHDSEHTITMTIPAKPDAATAAGRNTARKTKSKAKEDGPKRKNAKTRSDKVGGPKDTCKNAVKRKRSLDLNDLVEVVSESSDKEDIDFKCVKRKVSEPRSDKVGSPKKDRLSKDAGVIPSLDDNDTHDDRVELVSDSEDVGVKRRKTDVESNPDDESGVSKVTLLLVNPSDISEVSTVIDLNSDDECT